MTTPTAEVVRQVDRIIFNLGSNCQKRKRGDSDEAAPAGLERQYYELLHVLQRGLLGTRVTVTDRPFAGEAAASDCSTAKQNASALLFGGRGSGKTWVVEQCLQKLEIEAKLTSTAQGFRVVRLNGLLMRGDDVGAAVRDITRQIANIALEESLQRIQGDQDQSVVIQLKDVLRKESLALRTRKTSFNSMLSFLDEVLHLARVDSIPLLIVLDELDAFLTSAQTIITPTYTGPNHASISYNQQAGGSRLVPNLGTTSPSNRQLLLYHILDRVADHSSLISFVGITTRLSTVGMFEKRVKSRAEGTSKVIYFGHLTSYSVLVDSLLGKFNINAETNCISDDTSLEDVTLMESVKNQLKIILSTSENHKLEKINNGNPPRDKVARLFHRNYMLGKNFRWFSRVISVALSLAVGDFLSRHSLNKIQGDAGSKDGEENISNFILTPHHLLQGLRVMSGSSMVDLELEDDKAPTTLTPICYDTPRLMTLLDLSGVQLAVLLAANRILSRDSQGSNTSPFSYEDLYREYFSSFVRSGKSTGSDDYDEPIFFKAFVELNQMGMIESAKDHSGGGPLQYKYDKTRFIDQKDQLIVKKLPLHVNVDVNMELGVALKQGHLVGCTTALKEWGSKTN